MVVSHVRVTLNCLLPSLYSFFSSDSQFPPSFCPLLSFALRCPPGRPSLHHSPRVCATRHFPPAHLLPTSINVLHIKICLPYFPLVLIQRICNSRFPFTCISAGCVLFLSLQLIFSSGYSFRPSFPLLEFPFRKSTPLPPFSSPSSVPW